METLHEKAASTGLSKEDFCALEEQAAANERSVEAEARNLLVSCFKPSMGRVLEQCLQQKIDGLVDQDADFKRDPDANAASELD
ncbi:hypothetical protein [uncultured Tateyamaria sp.]|uniref:hypothetical protein n=1 Tax=uncultured Tateyamaria sp. TaxID=455651 RepID=UPI00262EF642|nr:hypothetical protein [uncultured Tateyamaria sp.]